MIKAGEGTMRLADFGQQMRKYRKNHGLTQEQLADIFNVQTKHISFLENGHRNPSPELQKKLEDMIIADEINRAMEKEDRLLSEEEMTVQIKLFNKLCKLGPVQKETALDMIYKLLDAMAKNK